MLFLLLFCVVFAFVFVLFLLCFCFVFVCAFSLFDFLSFKSRWCVGFIWHRVYAMLCKCPKKIRSFQIIVNFGFKYFVHSPPLAWSLRSGSMKDRSAFVVVTSLAVVAFEAHRDIWTVSWWWKKWFSASTGFEQRCRLA